MGGLFLRRTYFNSKICFAFLTRKFFNKQFLDFLTGNFLAENFLTQNCSRTFDFLGNISC